MRNTLGDLNLHLFSQLERLSDESLEGDKLKEEMERAKSIAIISSQIIQTNNLVLKAYKTKQESMACDFEIPKILKG